MNADGHQQKAEDIENSLQELFPDPEGKHVVAIVELTYDLLQHLIAFGMEKNTAVIWTVMSVYQENYEK